MRERTREERVKGTAGERGGEGERRRGEERKGGEGGTCNWLVTFLTTSCVSVLRARNEEFREAALGKPLCCIWLQRLAIVARGALCNCMFAVIQGVFNCVP